MKTKNYKKGISLFTIFRDPYGDLQSMKHLKFKFASWGAVYEEMEKDGKIKTNCMTDHNGPIGSNYKECVLDQVNLSIMFSSFGLIKYTNLLSSK